MQTRAALLTEAPGRWAVKEVELDEPRADEVLVRYAATGLCHSDDHFASGDISVATFPFVGGHEGAGVVQALGPGVTSLEVGDHIVTAFVPSCGRCRWCTTGQQNLCDLGALMLVGSQLDGTFRMHLDGVDVAQGGCISTFAEWAVVPVASCIRIPREVPLRTACIVGCGVPTGWGSSVRAACISAGDVVIVMGTGGVGMNAVQGARYVGASRVIAVDPVELKRDLAMQLGATDGFAGMEPAVELARSLTNGQGADAAVVTVGVVNGGHLAQAFAAIRKGGTVVATAAGAETTVGIPVNLLELTMFQKRIQGAIYGMGSPAREIPLLLDLYRRGDLKLDELITRTYTLDEINDGFDDMKAGRIVRGVVDYGWSDEA